MVDFLNLDRCRARHRPRACDDRQLQVRHHRGRAEMRAGQARRELDLASRRASRSSSRMRSTVRRYGAAVVVMAFDEQGQADTLARKVAICTRAYTHPHPRGRLSARRHHLRSRTSSPSRPASRSTTITGSTSSRPTRAIRERPCRTSHISGGVSNLSASPSAGTRRCARRCTRCSSTTPSQAGMDMGIVNAGQLAVYGEIEPALREACKDVVLEPPSPTRPSACSPSPRAFKGKRCREPPRPSDAEPGARRPSPSGWSTRWSTASRTSSTPTPRKRARPLPPARST